MHAGQDCVAVVDPADDQCIHQRDSCVQSECSPDPTQLRLLLQTSASKAADMVGKMTVLGRWSRRGQWQNGAVSSRFCGLAKSRQISTLASYYRVPRQVNYVLLEFSTCTSNYRSNLHVR